MKKVWSFINSGWLLGVEKTKAQCAFWLVIGLLAILSAWHDESVDSLAVFCTVLVLLRSASVLEDILRRNDT